MQRRLAAIMAADMVGYSRLMNADEEGTIDRQKLFRKTLIDPQIAEKSGRIVNTSGDGMLVEFASVVDAVNCAVTIQKELSDQEGNIPAEKRIRYRIGINSGDVVVDGDDILGDGVNIAARLEALAEPGGICISDHAYQGARGKLDLEFEDMGPQQVKNISDPVRAWRWRNGLAANAPALTDGARTAPELPDKPSIAVLPFNNMSGDAEQEYFADGMAEDIITELSRMPWFFVIARNSSFAYKGRSVDVKHVGIELGVAYVLEGSVRKAGNRLRINAQLIDARTGNHVWAERYDREITDIFDIQDEINQAIVSAVAPEFVSAEVRRSQRKNPADLDAWECVMRGRAHLWKMGRADSDEARALFKRAIELSAGRLGLSDLALVHFLDAAGIPQIDGGTCRESGCDGRSRSAGADHPGLGLSFRHEVGRSADHDKSGIIEQSQFCSGHGRARRNTGLQRRT
jgi:adenylate cyclase